MPMSIKLTGKAARWLQLLEDFGHLTPEDTDRLLVGAAELAPDSSDASLSRPSVVDEQLIRRAAAIMLFGQVTEEGLLDEDWPLLFT